MTKAIPKTHLIFGQVEPNWALMSANEIIRSYPISQSGSASGKFSAQYNQYMFHKSSTNPLIKTFISYCESRLPFLSTQFDKPFSIEWAYLTHCSQPEQEICIPHKDGHWMDGQIHLTIQGQANIQVWEDTNPWTSSSEEDLLLAIPNGTIWYLNGTQHYHSILPQKAPLKHGRIELLAPVNPHGIDDYKNCLFDNNLKLINPNCDNWKEIKKKQIQFEEEAQQKKESSSPYNIGYIKGFNIDD